MKGRDRNRPCWCGSGEKYKHCHLGREAQPRPSIWDARKAVQQVFKAKVCLHPLAGPATCAGPIVRAHTVRRAADLSVIARGGHVYQTSADLADLHKHGGKLVPKLIGIREASTFFGFCAHHDATTFEPLEQADLVPTPEQAFLLAYRPLCKELYLKERQRETLGITRQTDKGLSPADQFRVQEFVLLAGVGVEAAIRDLQRHKTRYDRDLLAANFAQVRYVAIHLDRVPDVMCSGVVQPQYDFGGRHIQDLGDIARDLQLMSFSLAATPGGGVAVFAWRADSDAAGSALADSLLALPQDRMPDALLRYATSELENTYFRPDWWEALPTEARDALLERLAHNASPLEEVDAGYLHDDGRRAVAWAVTGIVQHRA